jgi:hypothetical protein
MHGRLAAHGGDPPRARRPVRDEQRTNPVARVARASLAGAFTGVAACFTGVAASSAVGTDWIRPRSAAPAAGASAEDAAARSTSGAARSESAQADRDRPPRRGWTRARSLRARTAEADIALHDASVSRSHARIEARPEGHTIVDLDSTNGVFVNSVRVSESPVVAGDVVALGNVTIFVDEA